MFVQRIAAKPSLASRSARVVVKHYLFRNLAIVLHETLIALWVPKLQTSISLRSHVFHTDRSPHIERGTS